MSEGEARRLGEALGRTAERGCALALVGPLGVGKTVVAQGVMRGLGWSGRVPSPTFGLMRQYDGRLRAVHLDLYRLEAAAPEDVEWLGEAVEGAELAVVEWPERAWSILPQDRLVLALERDGAARRAQAAPSGPRSRAWWERARQAFEAWPGGTGGGDPHE